MATHSSILAWEIPWTEKPGGLQSMESPNSWTRVNDYTTIIQANEKKRKNNLGEGEEV